MLITIVSQQHLEEVRRAIDGNLNRICVSDNANEIDAMTEWALS